MAKGISPLRLFMRSNSKKSLTEPSDGSSSGQEPSASTTPQRQPLCPIPESMRNPLTPPLEQSIPDAGTPKSKADQSTPRANAKLSFSGQEKHTHLENSEPGVNTGAVNGTPDKNCNGSLASSAVASNSKSKFTWQTHHSSSVSTGGSGSRTSPAQARFRAQQENIPVEDVSDKCTPPRGYKHSSVDGSQVTAGLSNSSGVMQQQSVPSSARGGSTLTTPKSSTIARSGYDSETRLHNQQNGTPSKSVSRALKYGQQQQLGTNNASTAGLANVRSTGSQHVITRSMGILQAVKGAGCQTINNLFVEQQFDLEEDPNFWTDHNVQYNPLVVNLAVDAYEPTGGAVNSVGQDNNVLIRTRPLNSSELSAQGTSRCLRQESPHTLTWLGQPESRYTFDQVAGENITQEKLFSVAGLPMVENCMSGYNSCMFAYGQTGSGKTHTMLGDIDDLDHRPSDKRGMTPRVFEYLFSKILTEQESRRTEQLKYFCKCSFLEIYNEQITDLLEPTSTNLQLREDAKKGVYVENLTEVEVRGVQDVIQLLLQGSANRKVASTNMNRESSRSHSVFTCIVESKWEANSMTNSRYGRLHLVDLAGSERQKTSGAEGGRLKEAANINKSLSTLGLVIMILVDVANGKQRHVPYRDSKLTFLLQDSLGGNSKTIMIANVSPSSCCAMETLSTLKFAQRAKFIRNNAVINEDASGDVMVLRQQIQELKVEVDRLRRESISRTPSIRFGSSLQNGSTDGDNSWENVDSGGVDSSHSPDSAHVKTKAYIIERKLKGMEAVLAGALRREHVAEDSTKKMAAEIEQLNRLVHQREEDSQCSKMMLRFREDKIRRLERVADGVLSAELYYKEEQKALMEELQLIRGRIDRNPELTRFAMENIRLMEQLRRYQEFYDCGEKDVLLTEIAGLRNQLLDILDAKLGEEPGQLTTPQKRALAPEIAARARENELLLIEVQGYQKEVKECRNNLNNCLEANAELTRQVDQMQAMITQLKAECLSKQQEVEALKIIRDEERTSDNSDQERNQRTIEELKAELRKNEERWASESKVDLQLQEQLEASLHEAANLRAELDERSSMWREELTSSEASAERAHCTEACLAAAQETALTAQATVKQIRLETEEIALQQQQSLTSIQEAAVLWRIQESELRTQLNNAQDVIDQLTSRIERDDQTEDAGIKEPAQDEREKVQELEMRHSEDIAHLQLELDSMENVLKEEQQLRFEAEQRIEDLTKKLGVATSKLENDKNVVEAFEEQSLFSIHELESVQAELAKVSNQLHESEIKVGVLEGNLHELEEMSIRSECRRNHSEAALHTLQMKLEKARREREEVRVANQRFKTERASRIAQERETEDTRTQAETETALALTSMQEEILELREEVAAASETEALARLQFLELKQELEEVGHRNEQLQLRYESLASEKDAELRNLQKDWESATAKLIDYLAEGDEELIEAAREMDDMVESAFSPRLVGAWKALDVVDHENLVVSKKQKAFEILYQHLREAQSLARDTERSVRSLGEGSPQQKSGKGAAVVRDLEKKTTAAFVLVTHLSDTIKELKAANAGLAAEKRELCSAVSEKETIIATLQQEIQDDRCHQDAIAGQYQILGEGHDRLRHELENAVHESDVLKFQVEELELKLARSFDVIEKVQGMVIDVEKQVLEVEATAIACLQRTSRDEELVLERGQHLASLIVELDRILDSVSPIVTGTVDLDSLTTVLLGVISKVTDSEETVESYRSTITALQSKLSEATTTLELKIGELEGAERNYEASQLVLKEERALLTQEMEHTRSESASLRADVQSLEANLKQAELKVSEMMKGVEALTIAKQDLEIERNQLMVASREAEKQCSEKQQALVQIQTDLCQLQSRVNEAEVREQSISMRMEELIFARQEWECEKTTLVQEVKDMSVQKGKLELDIGELKSELEEKERTMFKTLRRGQLVLEQAELKLSALDEELKHFEERRDILEQDITSLELAASWNLNGLEEKAKELIDMQMKFETVHSQMINAQKSLESLNAEIVSERTRWMTDKEQMEQAKKTLDEESFVSQSQLQEQLARAESKLSFSEMDLKSATKEVQELSAQKSDVELELVKAKEDVWSAFSNLKLQEYELEELRASSGLLKRRCEEGEDKVGSLQNLLQQYVMSEESWKAERAQLVEKLKEVESMSASTDHSSKEDGEMFSNVSCSEEVPHSHIQRLKLQVEGLKRKISEKDNTILSARKEMEVAIANLKEAELEMDKLQAEKETLMRTCEESVNTITSISTSLRTAEEEVLRKQVQIEAFEKEMQKVGDIVTEWEAKMLDAEKLWKIEKEELVKEVDSAKLEAREKGDEAAILNRKFQDGQGTLMEAEALVTLLVRANEKAKHNALDWKSERDELRESQGVWEPERERLVAAINCLKMEMNERESQTLSICLETAAELSEAMNIINSVQEEISLLQLEYEREMYVLSDTAKNIRSGLLHALLPSKQLGEDVGTLCSLFAEQRRSFVEAREQNAYLSGKLHAAEDSAQLHLLEVEALKEKLAASALELETKASDLQAVESTEATSRETLVSVVEKSDVLEAKLASAAAETSELRIRLLNCESQGDGLHNDLLERSEEVENLQAQLSNAENEIRSLNETVLDLTNWKAAAEEELSELRKEVSVSEANLDQLKDLEEQRDDAEFQSRKLELELASGEMEIMIDSLNRSIQQLTLERDSADNSLSQLRVEISNAEANVKHLKEELEEGRKGAVTLEHKLSELQTERRVQVSAISANATASEAQISELKAEVKDLQSQIRVLEQKLVLAETEMDEYVQSSNGGIFQLTVEREALQIQSNAHSEALSKLDEKLLLKEAQIEELKQYISSLDGFVAEQNEAMAVLKRQLQAANTDNDTLSEIVSGLQVEIIEAEAKISQLETVVEENKLRLSDLVLTDAEKDEYVEALTAERNDLRAESMRQYDALQNMEEELVGLRAEITEHKQKEAKYDSEVQMILRELDTETHGNSVEVTHLHVRICQLKDDVEKERSTVKELKDNLVRVERENIELIDQLEAQLIAQSTAIIGLEEEMSMLKEARAKDQVNFDIQTSELKETLNGERSRSTCLEEKLEMVEKENRELNSSLDEKVQQLRAERDEFQMKASKVKIELEEGMRTVQDLEEKLAAAEQDNAAALQTLDQKSRRLAEERHQLQVQLMEQADSLARLQEEMNFMREQRAAKEQDFEKSDVEFHKNESKVVGKDAERDIEMLSSNKALPEDLKQTCKSLLGENDELKCEIIALEGKVLDLQEEIERMHKVVGDLEAKLKREKEKCLEHENSQSIRRDDTQAVVVKLELKDKEIEYARANLEQLAQENEGLQFRLAASEDTVLHCEKEIERRKNAEEVLEEKLSCEEENNLKQQAHFIKKLQDLQLEIDMLQRELMQQLDIQKGLMEELKHAEIAGETVSNENGRLLKCVSDIEQSHALCVNEVFTQALVGAEGFRAAQMELETVGEEIVDIQLRSEAVLLGKLEISQEELCHATRAVHELRGQMKGLWDLSSATETIVCNKLAMIDNLRKEVLLKDRHLVELEADRVATLEELKNERRWVLKCLEKLLKKLQGVTSETRTAVWSDQEIRQRGGDSDHALTVLNQQMDSIDEELDLVLVENRRMKADVVSIQRRVVELEDELDQKGREVKRLTCIEEEQRHENQELKLVTDKQVQQLSHSSHLLRVYKHEIETLQQTLLSTVEYFENPCFQVLDLSLIGQELDLLLENVRKIRPQMMLPELKEEIYTFQHTATELQLRYSALEEELDEKRQNVDLLADDLMLERENSLRTIQKLKQEIKVSEAEQHKLQTEVLVLTEQLEMAQSLADEREIVAAEARQIAELSKSQAEKKGEEAKILETSVEELESTVYALESQLGIVKREAERQRRAKEDVESEFGAMKQQMQLMKITIDRQDAQTARDFEDAKSAKTELDRMVIEMKNQQKQTRKTVESLQQECADKDVQLRSCKAHIAELMSNAEKQGTENQQKLKVLETMVEQLKMDERKVNSTALAISKPAESRNTANRAKGSGSPFKCIGAGLAQQRTSEIDEELSTARKRIRELEATAAARQKEVFMLNTKLAEAESMTHDVVRDLLGVKMDIASYATLLSQQKVQQIADKARRRTEEAHQKEEELDNLRDRLDELITERESWLEEINRRQAESVAARVSAEKLRLRDSLLANENEKLKVEVSSLRRKVSDLEEEYRKLSGQQNLQQRIHHHAKIKEENNVLKSQNEDLSGKLRRTEILFSRVNDELARYRNAEGKTPFLNFDEEERLRKKLQETEENRMQLAQNFVSLCTAIITAAGVPRTSREVDAATAMNALLQLQDRLEAMERELLDMKLKARIANERRRMSDLREQHTPRKNVPTNFTANQQITSPDSSSR